MTTASPTRNSVRADFPVSPTDARLVWFLPGIAVFCVIVGSLVLIRRQPEAWVMLPATVLILGVIGLILRRRHVRVLDGMLVIAAGLHTRRIAISDLELASARVVDLREHTEWKPSIKLLGTGVPGLSMGHFRLRNSNRAFVLVTDPSRVLVLTERSGRRLLLSLAKPQALLDALQDRTGKHT